MRELYLVTLYAYLRKPLGEEIAGQRVAEIRSHLHLSIVDLRASGLSDDDAELDALRKLGSARMVADDLIRQHRGYGRKSAWVLALLPISLFVAIDLIYIFAPAIMLNPSYVWDVLRGYSWVPIFAVFGWMVWQTRRWLVLPMVALSLVASVGLGVALRFTNATYGGEAGAYFYSPPSEYGGLSETWFSNLTRIRHDLQDWRGINRTVANGGHVPFHDGFAIVPEKVDFNTAAWMPGTIIPARTHLVTTYYNNDLWSGSQEEADQRWREWGPHLISTYESVVVDLETYKGQPHWVQSLSDFRRDMWLAVETLAMNTAFLIATNWLVLLVAAWRRRSAGRRDPMFA